MKHLLWLGLFALVSCSSSVSKQECEKMDWVQRGIDDGSQGIPSAQVAKYSDRCQYFGMFIDRPGYLQGHTDGLRKYCSFAEGKKKGLEGADPFFDCDRVTMDFRRGFDEGNKTYSQQKLQSEMEEKRDEIKEKVYSSMTLGKLKCSSDSDCDRVGNCTFGKCEHNNKECVSNSECEIEGECLTIKRPIPELKETVTAEICREYN